MAVTPHARGNEYKNWLAHDMTITRKWDHSIFTKNTHEIIIRCQNLVKDNQCSLGFGSWQNYGIVDSRYQTKHFQ